MCVRFDLTCTSLSLLLLFYTYIFFSPPLFHFCASIDFFSHRPISPRSASLLFSLFLPFTFSSLFGSFSFLPSADIRCALSVCRAHTRTISWWWWWRWWRPVVLLMNLRLLGKPTAHHSTTSLLHNPHADTHICLTFPYSIRLFVFW